MRYTLAAGITQKIKHLDLKRDGGETPDESQLKRDKMDQDNAERQEI